MQLSFKQKKHNQQEQRQRQANYLVEDTIVACATAVGGPLAMIRMSGPESLMVLTKLVRGLNRLEPGRVRRVTLFDDQDRRLDEAVLVFFRNPKSFTGQDSAEVTIHGSAFIAKRVLEAMIKAGARQALAGEFSFRAFRNGKMDLNQAQAVSDLIGSQNQPALELALEKLSGSQSSLLSAINTDLRTLTAKAELGIDFSDQDVAELSLEHLKQNLREIDSNLQRLSSSYARGRKIQEGIDVALLGLPNAGKSSLFNAIACQDRSIVTDLPGTTRDVIRETVTLENEKGSFHFNFLDTAGLREPVGRIEAIGVKRSLEAAQRSDLLLWLIDPLSSQEDSERELEKLDVPREKILRVFTKSDLKKLDGQTSTSAVTHEGIDKLIGLMIEWALMCAGRERGEVLITSVDQKNAIDTVLTAIDRAQSAKHYDLFTADLRVALGAMAPVVGQVLPDDILGDIFSKFCIGK